MVVGLIGKRSHFDMYRMMLRLTDLLIEIDIEQHLRDRGVDLKRTYVILDKKSGVATFLLYNLSGKLVGIQKYDPTKDKTRDNFGRYITTVTGKKKERQIAVWGTETIKMSVPFVFVVEGVFDAVKIHNAGYPAVAVLANDPKMIRPWFKALSKVTIAVTDRDTAGQRLARSTDKSVTVPEPYKDLGEMPQLEVNVFLKSALR